MDNPFAACPSWSLRIECDRCGKMRMISETHIPVPAVTLLRDIIEKMRHDGCGGRAGRAELITGIGGSQQPAGAADPAAKGVTVPAKKPGRPQEIAALRAPAA